MLNERTPVLHSVFGCPECGIELSFPVREITVDYEPRSDEKWMDVPLGTFLRLPNSRRIKNTPVIISTNIYWNEILFLQYLHFPLNKV